MYNSSRTGDRCSGELRAASLAVAEQRTGVAFDRAWLVAKLQTYRIPGPDVLLKGVAGAQSTTA